MSKNRIKILREHKGLTQELLAGIIGVSQQRLSQIEAGSIEPTPTEIKSLVKELGSNLDDMFIDEDTIGKCNGILITYIPREDHVDPNFNLLVYGEMGLRETAIKNILDKHRDEETYIFFNTTIGGKRYITAYYKIAEVLYKGTDNIKINALKECSAKLHDDMIILGDREESKILTLPLLFDKKLALSLYSLDFTEEQFNDELTELAVISNKTRQHRSLSEADTKILLEKCITRG